ncbi:putative cenp-O kinetochore centromere component [Rhypophila decipiens]
MASSTSQPSDEEMQKQIQAAQAKLKSLKKELNVKCAQLLTHPEIRKLLEESDPSLFPDEDTPLRRRILEKSDAQISHNQECLYRMMYPVTSFKAHDPDPNAVDNGHVLGIRFEVMNHGRFLRPYYVLLNRPWPDHPRHVRVHRHTVPACIPLSGFAARCLPSPAAPSEDSGDGEGNIEKDKARPQDLEKFVSLLRRDIVGYHNRLTLVQDLRSAAGLDTKENDGRETGPDGLVNIAPVDPRANHILFEWADGRAGRLVIADDGEVIKMVVLNESGRDRETVASILGGIKHAEEIAIRLKPNK